MSAAFRIKVKKYLPLLALLGLLGFTKDQNNDLNFHYFAFFAFLGAYWEYKIMSNEPDMNLLNKCQDKIKSGFYVLAYLGLYILLILAISNLVNNTAVFLKISILQLGLVCFFFSYITYLLYKKEYSKIEQKTDR